MMQKLKLKVVSFGAFLVLCAVIMLKPQDSTTWLRRQLTFDLVAKHAYETATKPVNNTKREHFTLEGWERGSGGLDDADRLTLGKIYHEAESVFEFGLGESTYIAAAVGVPRYAGVDSDAQWVANARNKAADKKDGWGMDHFRFHFADIGKTHMWGYPDDKNLQKNMYNYQVQSLRSEQTAFDVYLVDGRYRVACACLSFLHAMKYKADMSKVLVGVHDSGTEHRGYSVLKDVADVVIQNQKLWVYKLKGTTTEEQLTELWKKSMDTLF